jgi:hypothetical protein
VGSCERGIEHSGFIKGGETLMHLNNYWLLNKCFALHGNLFAGRQTQDQFERRIQTADKAQILKNIYEVYWNVISNAI